jgi:hypothetical protein
MAGLDDILKKVKKSFKPRKNVDIDDLHIEIEPLNTVEEVKVLEAIKELEGSEYLEALKRFTLAYAIKKIDDVDLDGDEITYTENGVEKTKSKFLFMKDYMGQWPQAIIDSIFDDPFTNLLMEVEQKVKSNIKFERFLMSDKPAPEEKPLFKKVTETSETPMEPVEKLNKQVQDEVDQANVRMAQAEEDAKR